MRSCIRLSETTIISRCNFNSVFCDFSFHWVAFFFFLQVNNLLNFHEANIISTPEMFLQRLCLLPLLLPSIRLQISNLRYIIQIGIIISIVNRQSLITLSLQRIFDSSTCLPLLILLQVNLMDQFFFNMLQGFLFVKGWSQRLEEEIWFSSL